MRILLIHQYFLEEDDPGGSRFNEMTRYWSEKGNQITVLCGMVHYSGQHKRPEYKGKFVVSKKHGQVDVLRCHVSESYNVSFLGRLWGYFSFVFSSLCAGLFYTRQKFDLILVTSPPLFVGITAYLLSRFKRIPYLFEVRDLWPESAIDTGVLRNKFIIWISFRLEQFIYKKAKRINVLTPAFRTNLIDKKQIPAEKIIFIPNAADFSLSDELLQQFERDAFRNEQGIHDKFVITYVGAHGVANHLEQILDAAELLRETPVLFQLIGDGMQKNYLKKEVKTRNLPNIRFVDPVPKKEVFKYIMASEMGASVLKKVDAFKTIYSNKTFDYMACRIPVLLLIDGVSRELVEEADCGLYAEPENPAEIAEKIRFCMDNPEKIKEQGNNGYHYAKEHFDRLILASRYMDQMQSFNLISRS